MGWLHVITGPMFSGKTEELIRLLRRHEIAGKSVSVYRPALDTRSTMLISRSGVGFPATYARDAEYLMLADTDVVAIDEAQFFDPQIVEVVGLIALDSHVIVSGLDKDFSGKPFGSMPELLAIADQVTKLTAICTTCGSEATMTQRLVDSRDIVVLGGIGDDTYAARCREHHTF